MTAFDIRGPLPTGTIVLQASAGTGKTAAIAGLFARFVAEGVASHVHGGHVPLERRPSPLRRLWSRLAG